MKKLMKDKEKKLPEFTNPPINEVVAGVFFKPIEGFKLPHFGLFWDQIKEQYPHFDQTHPIVRNIAGTDWPWPRVWLLDEKKTSLVQLQRDCLIFNWRRVAGNETYPRFSKVIDDFNKQLGCFTNFLREQNLPATDVQNCELTYINHIPRNGIWKEPTDIGNIMPELKWNSSDRFLKPFESCAWSGVFALPEDFGQLTVKVNYGKKRIDGTPIYVLELSAKGLGGGNSLPDINRWFDLAHEWIVKGFCDLTDENVQKTHWGKKD